MIKTNFENNHKILYNVVMIMYCVLYNVVMIIYIILFSGDWTRWKLITDY